MIRSKWGFPWLQILTSDVGFTPWMPWHLRVPFAWGTWNGTSCFQGIVRRNIGTGKDVFFLYVYFYVLLPSNMRIPAKCLWNQVGYWCSFMFGRLSGWIQAELCDLQSMVPLYLSLAHFETQHTYHVQFLLGVL
jgi:hypothetical protein